MAATSTALTIKVENGSPYQLSSEQTLKASQALLKHIKTAEETSTSKPNLLAGATDEEEASEDSTPIWLTLTTKKHISAAKSLKPTRLAVPHPLNTSPNSTVCLITADPQRTFKDIVASPAFPTELSARITRVIGISKLKIKYKQYEAQRQLLASHDIFLADDRIITLLPKALGKVFYKTTVKRPLPITLAERKSEGGKKASREKNQEGKNEPLVPCSPKKIAAEVEKAIQSAVVHISPSTNTAVRVGYASWEAEKLRDNVEAVAVGLIEKFVTQKWRGVKALHIKGPETASLPIWLADEMWVDDDDILEDGAVVEANTGKKRKAKALEDVKFEAEVKDAKKKQKLLESNDDTLDKEIAARKDKLKKQKAEAAKVVEDDVPKPTKKAKKTKVKTETAL